MAMSFSIKNILGSTRGIISAVVIALLVLIGLWRSVWATDSDAVIYTTEAVVRGDIENLVTATGTLQPQDYVDVGAQVSGQLEKLHVDIGSEVKAGDLLAEIDATVYAARVDATRASLRTQQAQLLDREAQLTLANIKYEREKNLFKEDATTSESLQTAEANLKSARAQLSALQAQIEQTESTLRVEAANLNYAKIYAPIDGTVVSITSRQGQTLNTNQMAPTIMRISDLSTMTVQTQVSEADIGKLRKDMAVYFTTLGSQGRRWYSKLDRIQPTPEILNNVVLYNALFDVPNENRLLMTQMSTQVFFIESQAKDVLLVPMSALSFVPASGERSSANAPRGEFPPRDKAPADKAIDSAGKKSAAPIAGDSPRMERRNTPDSTQSLARPGMVKVMKADGRIEERRVLVGVTNRVQAQIIEGLAEGELVVSGSSRPTQPKAAAGMGMGGPGMGMGRR
ncbi:MAG TPA: efflux RND transporter periplasmic adaptor subunit [Cellvibrio sp.]